MISNDHPDLLAARAKLEAGRVLTNRRPEAVLLQADIVSGYQGDPVAVIHQADGSWYQPARAIKAWPTAAEAVEAWLRSALLYAGEKPFIEWRVEPEIEERNGEWRVYSRFAAFRDGQHAVWPDVLVTREEA